MESSKIQNDYWRKISQTCLTDKEVILYAPHLDWHEISQKAVLKHETWCRLKNYIDHTGFSINEYVGIETYKAIPEKTNWSIVAKVRPTAEEFLLQVPNEYPTLFYLCKNPGAHMVSDDTWEKIKLANLGRLHSTGRRDYKQLVRQQILSDEAIISYGSVWEGDDWAIISRYQPITGKTILRYKDKLDFDLLTENKHATITKDELDELERTKVI